MIDSSPGPKNPEYFSPSSLSPEHRPEPTAASSGERFRLLVESARDYAMFTQDRQGRIDSWNIGAERILGWTEPEIIGQDCAIIFTPEDRAAGAPEQEKATARQTGRAEDERWHIRKDGSRFFASGVMTLLTDEGGDFLGYAKVLRDLTEIKRQEDELQRAKEELEQKVQERTQQLLEQTARQRAQESELRRALDIKVEEERRRISRELHDQTGQHLVSLGLQLGVMEQAARATREAARDAAQAASLASRAAREAAQSAETAAGVAAQVDSVPEAARLAREASEAARTAAITATDASSAANAAHAALAVVEEAAPQLAKMRTMVTSLFGDLHRIAIDLRPPSLDDMGLLAALEGCAREYSERAGLAVEVESVGLEEEGDDRKRLSPEVETALFRIVQEALTNVAKHAKGASRVSVTLHRMEDQVLAAIEDNGAGFDPDATGTGPLGLAGMRERAALLGGTLTVESSPGRGTTIFARLPLLS